MADKDGKVEEEEVFPVEVDASGKPISAQGGDIERDADDDDEADEDDRAHLDAGGDGDTKRRDERQRQKQRRRQAAERSKQQLTELQQTNQQLTQRLARLEQNAGSTSMAQLDDRINVAKAQMAQANAFLQDAIAKNDSARVVRAMEARDATRDTVNYLGQVKQRFTQELQQGNQGNQGRGDSPGQRQNGKAAAGQEDLDPAVQRHVQRFIKKNDWWDPAGGDVDSKIMLALDDEVANSGLDPADADYWRELERLARERLPHRFKDGRRSPPVGGSSGEGAARRETGGKNFVKITPERKAALIEAGAWDDPAKRQKMMRAYQRYDAEHANQDRRA